MRSSLTGKLPPLIGEIKIDRIFWAFVAGMVVLGFFLSVHQYWVPSSGGADQNGYLVGGKFFAKTFSTGFKPTNPYAFVGHEWIEAKGKYFPKYPLGLSVIYALTLKCGGVKFGIPATFMVNPLAMALALVAVFQLGRLIVGSFFAVLATLLVATSPVCIGLTNTPSSHATAICLVAWGFYVLFRWWQSNGIAKAIGAGLLFGSAVTIRYTEGMLILPILIVVLLNLRRDVRRCWIESAILLATWALPVTILAAYNWFSMHHLTGYDTTNESTGFTWAKFQDNWEIMLRELYNTGLFFTLPIALFSSFLMFRWNWRVSLVVAAWSLPNLLLYTSYYWAPDGPNIGYLRFTLTIFPALAIVTLWGFRWITLQAANEKALATFAIAAVVAVGCGVNLNTALAASETESITDRNLLTDSQTVSKIIPAGSLIFSDDTLLNYLQFVGDYDLSDLRQFDYRQVQQYANVDPDAATAGLQPQRALESYARVKGLSDSMMARELMREQNQLMTDTLAQGKKVYFVLPANRRNEASRFLPKANFINTVITTWDMEADPRALGKQHWLGITRTNIQPDVPRSVAWQIIEVQAAPPLPPKPKLKSATTRPTSRKTSHM